MSLLPLVFILPLIGYLILAIARGRLSENVCAVVGVGSAGLAALVALSCGYHFLSAPPEGGAYTVVLWNWISLPNLSIPFELRLDALSVVMMGVITGVGFFIHLFASWYMRGDEDYGRFFSYMNLFVSMMLLLVLGNNLLLLYLGWEGVGLASYLLIGFWYKDSANGAAARKAFIITRIGDTFMAIALLMLYRQFGTLDIQTLAQVAPQTWAMGSTAATVVCLLLLGGAAGKSAQLPLQTWLADAMAGPTPVSALIHAATMVTAGVYLIARTHALFQMSPLAMETVAVVGAITLTLAGFTALMHTDIKKILAYSTMSQIGYMFLALGVGAFQPAIFHLMTHAFFKALLFLSSGSVILAMHHEQNIFKMGGLAKRIPFVFACMLIGSLALTAFPLTSGYFSKDEILREVYLSGHHTLWLLGLLGAFMTAVYTFRLIFITFFGPERYDAHHHAPHGAKTLDHHIPLAVLLVMSILGGLIHLPLDSVLPKLALPEDGSALAEHLPVVVSLAGIAVAWFLFLKSPGIPAALAAGGFTGLIGKFWRAAWGFDWLYDVLLVKPFVWLATVNRRDVFDQLVELLPAGFRFAYSRMALMQSGRMRQYAAVMFAGVCVVLIFVAFD